jgi:hypothetical protein
METKPKSWLLVFLWLPGRPQILREGLSLSSSLLRPQLTLSSPLPALPPALQNNLLSIIRAHEVQELGYHKHFDPAMITERLNLRNRSKYNRRVTSAVIKHGQAFESDSLAQPKSPLVRPSSTRHPFREVDENTSLPHTESFSSSETYECEIDIPSGER